MANPVEEGDSKNLPINLGALSNNEFNLVKNIILKRLAERAKKAQTMSPSAGIGYDSHQSVHSKIGFSGTSGSGNVLPGMETSVQKNLAPFVPTPQDVVFKMLQLADVKSRDIVYDLGCGDGRIVIAAALMYGAHGVGIDIDPYYVAKSQANAKEAGVDHITTFAIGDAMTTDISMATVVTLYLLHWSTLQLRPILTRQLQKGTRIISHGRGMGDWEPTKVENFTDAKGAFHTLYLWISDGEARS